MRLSNIGVEQITPNHEVLIDKGEILTNKELENIVISCFNGLKKKTENCMVNIQTRSNMVFLLRI